MSKGRHIMVRTMGMVLLLLSAGVAHARCDIDSAGLSITPLTANTGTHTPPSTPPAQSVTFTVTGTYDTNNNASDLTCRFAVAFNRVSPPVTMARSGGGATLTYTVTSAGGASLVYTGGGDPTSANRLLATFPAAGLNRNNVPFTLTFTIFFQQQPSSPQRAGSYSDNITLRMYNVRPNGNLNSLGSRTFAVTGTVALACTIGGVANPAAASATIPVNAAGNVNVAPIARTFANVICNSLSTVQTQSLNGAIRQAATSPSGFTNLINYSASATFGGVSSTLNTATIPTASGSETGTTVTTASATPTGSLNVTITPQSPAQPLIAGSYSDTLRITITPQ